MIEMSDRYDAGLLPEPNGADDAWWQDAMRAELDRAHDHYDAQIEAAERRIAELEADLNAHKDSCMEMALGKERLEKVLRFLCNEVSAEANRIRPPNRHTPKLIHLCLAANTVLSATPDPVRDHSGDANEMVRGPKRKVEFKFDERSEVPISKLSEAERAVVERAKLWKSDGLAGPLWDALDNLAKLQSREGSECPDGLLPDGDRCPKCGGPRAPSGIGGGTWVHVRKAAP